VCKTFASESEAAEWARVVEQEIKDGYSSSIDVPLAVLVNRYMRHDPDMGTCKADALKHLRAGLGRIYVSKLRVFDVTQYVKKRGYGPSTAQVEMSALNMLLKTSRVLWGYTVPDIMDDVKDYLRLIGCYKKSEERDRRPTAEELHRVGEWFDERSALPMRELMWFSIHSTMRASEVTRIQWADYDPDEKTVIIRNRKDPRKRIGNDQVVPLLDEAVEIIERQLKTSDYIFPYNAHTFSTLFPRACRDLGIHDLRWHDLRHEGTSRLFERGYMIPEVALFTGHKDWTMLRRYTHLKAKGLRRLPLPAEGV
jgi:integrase